MMRHRRRHVDGGLGDEAGYCSDDDNMSLLTADDRDGMLATSLQCIDYLLIRFNDL